MILAMDMSMRSSALVVVDFKGNLKHFELAVTEKDQFEFEEDLIDYIADRVLAVWRSFDVTQFVIEGLAFAKASQKKDVIAGIYWGVRCAVRRERPTVLIGSVPVSTWRNWMTTKAERDSVKKDCRDPLKNVVVMKTPIDVREEFMRYVVHEGYGVTALFDLCDAYWIATYRNHLNR
jgi:hypothetical protein